MTHDPRRLTLTEINDIMEVVRTMLRGAEVNMDEAELTQRELHYPGDDVEVYIKIEMRETT